MGEREDRIKERMFKFYCKNDPDFRPKRRRKKSPKVREHPLEDEEHALVVRYMADADIYFFHPPNEGKRSVWEGRRMFTVMGGLKGAADFYIFNHLPAFPSARGLAIELKRVAGSSPVWGRPEQHEHLNALADYGWKAYVARGHRATLAILVDCGLMEETVTDKDRSLVREFLGGESG
jgi:hypothetical protein